MINCTSGGPSSIPNSFNIPSPMFRGNCFRLQGNSRNRVGVLKRDCDTLRAGGFSYIFIRLFYRFCARMTGIRLSPLSRIVRGTIFVAFHQRRGKGARNRSLTGYKQFPKPQERMFDVNNCFSGGKCVALKTENCCWHYSCSQNFCIQIIIAKRKRLGNGTSVPLSVF